VLDVESTGLDLKSDEVISVGAVTILDGRIKVSENFYREIAPSRAPSIASIEVHGLREQDLSTAETPITVLPQLADYLSGQILVAHAHWVEEAFLSRSLKSYSFQYPKKVIDTASISRYLNLAPANNGHEPSLEFLAREMGLPVYSPHHALGDAMTTATLFLALVSRVEKLILENSGEVLTLNRLLNISKS
jgi:DNA polymerase-3 subunit epsilon